MNDYLEFKAQIESAIESLDEAIYEVSEDDEARNWALAIRDQLHCLPLRTGKRIEDEQKRSDAMMNDYHRSLSKHTS